MAYDAPSSPHPTPDESVPVVPPSSSQPIPLPDHLPSPSKYTCKVCPKSFSHRSGLSRHVSVSHRLEDAGFSCSGCSKKFIRKDHLLVHVVSGACNRKGMRDVSKTCHMCHKKFSSKWALHRHMISHKTKHKLTCENCDRCYTREDFLLIHQKTCTVSEKTRKKREVKKIHKDTVKVKIGSPKKATPGFAKANRAYRLSDPGNFQPLLDLHSKGKPADSTMTATPLHHS